MEHVELHLTWETNAVTKVLVWNCATDDIAELADKEVKSLSALAAKPGSDISFTTIGKSYSWRDLPGVVHGLQPQIFHFIGHGEDGMLLTSDGRDEREVFRLAEDVINVVSAGSSILERVFLSACFSAKNGGELLRPLPKVGGWVVGTFDGILGDEAADLSALFYEHLLGTDATAAKAERAFESMKAYASATYPRSLHSGWFSRSPQPRMEQMSRDIHKSLAKTFDRDAFRLNMLCEASLSQLDEALQHVSLTLQTGKAYSRTDNQPIPGVSFDPAWLSANKHMKAVTKRIRRGLSDARRELGEVINGCPVDGGIRQDIFIGVSCLDSRTPKHVWMARIKKIDDARNRILNAVSDLIAHAGLDRLDEIPSSYSQAEINEERRAFQAKTSP